MFLLRSTKIKGKRNFRRSNSLKQMKSSSFQLFLILFLMFLIISTIILLGMYIANYMVTKSFSDNVIDIMGDIESVETYIISIHIRFSLNAILMGLSDDTINRRTEKINKINELLKEIDILQSQITDLTYLFRTRSTSNILTTIKYEFFTNDICLLIENLKATENLDQDIKDIINRIKEKSFCEKLLKNVLTKGSSSFAFDLNEIFNQWRLFLQTNDFSVKSLQEIIGSQDFIDINYSLPYVYALGLNYLRIMLNKSNNYFDEIRVNMIIWFIFALLVCFFIFLGPMKIMINYLSKNLFRSLNLIKLFPFNMIANNKILENKISRMFRMQKV